MFYKLVFYSLWTERYAWSILNLLLDQSMIGCGSAQSKTSFRSVLTLHNHCIFLFGKYLHSPLWFRRRLAAARHSLSELSLCSHLAQSLRVFAGQKSTAQ